MVFNEIHKHSSGLAVNALDWRADMRFYLVVKLVSNQSPIIKLTVVHFPCLLTHRRCQTVAYLFSVVKRSRRRLCTSVLSFTWKCRVNKMCAHAITVNRNHENQHCPGLRSEKWNKILEFRNIQESLKSV